MLPCSFADSHKQLNHIDYNVVTDSFSTTKDQHKWFLWIHWELVEKLLEWFGRLHHRQNLQVFYLATIFGGWQYLHHIHRWAIILMLSTKLYGQNYPVLFLKTSSMNQKIAWVPQLPNLLPHCNILRTQVLMVSRTPKLKLHVHSNVSRSSADKKFPENEPSTVEVECSCCGGCMH